MAKYDIFISYRRKFGALYSRILQLKLQEKGYKVFLDYDELRDGHFDEKIKKAIEGSSLFVFMFSNEALDRCVNEDDWVRQEILCAIEQGKRIIPIIPDKEYSAIPADVPKEIVEAISKNEHSEIDYGKALDSSVDMLIEDRIVPHIGKRNPKEKRIVKWGAIALAIICVLLLSCRFVSDYVDYKSCSNMRELAEYQASHQGAFHFFGSDVAEELHRYEAAKPEDTFGLTFNVDDGITYSQLLACRSIIKQMIEVEGGTFMMGAADSDSVADDDLERPQLEMEVRDFLIGKYEVSVMEWCAIMGTPYDEADADLPMSNISWYECQAFVETLRNLMGVEFDIPTEAEWEWAARGGHKSQRTLFSGSDNVNEVAVYDENSDGKPHRRVYVNGDRLNLKPNELDIYDMSGNVEEWCSDDFREYKDLKSHTLNPKMHDGESKVYRGGSYMSSASDVRITTRMRKGPNKESATATVGLRLIIRR